jgi:hypothetical protein
MGIFGAFWRIFGYATTKQSLPGIDCQYSKECHFKPLLSLKFAFSFYFLIMLS